MEFKTGDKVEVVPSKTKTTEESDGYTTSA